MQPSCAAATISASTGDISISERRIGSGRRPQSTENRDSPAAGCAAEGKLPDSDNLDMPQRANQNWIALALALPLAVPAAGSAEAWAVLAYDDVLSIEYLHRRLPAYWRCKVSSFSELLTLAADEFDALRRECEGV